MCKCVSRTRHIAGKHAFRPASSINDSSFPPRGNFKRRRRQPSFPPPSPLSHSHQTATRRSFRFREATRIKISRDDRDVSGGGRGRGRRRSSRGRGEYENKRGTGRAMTGSPIAVQIIRILYDFRSRILRCRSVRRAVEFIKAIATHRLALLFPLHRFPFSSQIETDFPLSLPPPRARGTHGTRLTCGWSEQPIDHLYSTLIIIADLRCPILRIAARIAWQCGGNNVSRPFPREIGGNRLRKIQLADHYIIRREILTLFISLSLSLLRKI